MPGRGTPLLAPGEYLERAKVAYPVSAACPGCKTCHDRPEKQEWRMLKRFLFGTPVRGTWPSLGLLVHRIVFGGFMLVGHGSGKLLSFGEKAASFPDPLGIGGPPAMAGAIFAEGLCALLVVLGVATRAAVLPLIFTMAVAALLVHADGPLFLPGAGAREPALLYVAGYLTLLFTGAGDYSVDRRLGA
jgi:putative oxidoreductase